MLGPASQICAAKMKLFLPDHSASVGLTSSLKREHMTPEVKYLTKALLNCFNRWWVAACLFGGCLLQSTPQNVTGVLFGILGGRGGGIDTPAKLEFLMGKSTCFSAHGGCVMEPECLGHQRSKEAVRCNS